MNEKEHEEIVKKYKEAHQIAYACSLEIDGYIKLYEAACVRGDIHRSEQLRTTIISLMDAQLDAKFTQQTLMSKMMK